MHAQITCTYHGWKTPFYYWKFHCPWQTCAQEDDGSVLIYHGRCHFHYYPFIRHPSLGDAYHVVPTTQKRPPVGYVGPVTTHGDGSQLSAKENPFGLVLRSVTNVMVFDTVIPPGCSIGL